MLLEITSYRTVEGEPVHREEWEWVAIYDDGTWLRQFDPDTFMFHRFAEIDTDRLATLVVQRADDPYRRVEFHAREGLRFRYFYRNIILNATTKDEARVRLYCMEAKERVGDAEVVITHEIWPGGAAAIASCVNRGAH